MSRNLSQRNKATKRPLVDDDDDNENGSDHNSIMDSDEDESYKKPVKSARSKVRKFSDDEEDENVDVDISDDDEKLDYEAGQICKVYVENFMCHRKFTLEFNRHLNFVNGQNGSGKSAIAAALQLCLGATAKITGRGANLSSLIREGSDGPAIIRVTLLNEGNDAFKPEEYGNRIVIERKIAKGSGGGYKLISKAGITISSEKRELEQLLRTFNIYVDNPCCVLTQEESKKFIQGHEKDKYAFFLKATGLDRTKDELNDANKAIEETTGEIEKHKERLVAKKAVVDELSKTMENLRELEDFDEKIRLCRAMAYWDDHRVARRIAEDVQEKVNEKQGDLNAAQQEVDAAESRATNNSGELAVLSEQVGVLTQEVDEMKIQRTAKSKALADVSRQVNTYRASLSTAENARKTASTELKRLTKELDEKRNNAMYNAEKDERDVLEKIQTCQEQVQQRMASEASLKQQQHAAQERVTAVNREAQQLNAQVTSIGRDIDKLVADHRELSSGGQGKAGMFGRAGDILTQIGRTRFKGPVLGPVGMCVSMRDGYAEWGLALERVLGPVIRSFVVTCHEDRQALSGIIKNLRAGAMHNIILQQPHARYNVTNFSEAGVLVVAEALLVPDDLVFNALVDQVNLDRAALVEQEDDCRRKLVTRDGQGLDMLIRGLSSATTKKGTQIKYNRGNQSSEVSRVQYKAVLAKDATEYIQRVAQQIDERKREQAELETRRRALKAEFDEATFLSKKFDRPLQDNAAELRKLGKTRGQLDSQLLEVQAAGQEDLGLYDQDISDLTGDIDKAERDCADLQAQLHVAEQEKRARETDKKELDQTLGVLEQNQADKLSQMEKILNDKENFRRKLDTLRKNVASKQDALKKVLDSLAAAREKEERQLEVAREKTAEMVRNWNGEPLALRTKDTRSFLDKEETEIRARVDALKRNAGLEGVTLAIIQDRLAKADLDYRALRTNYKRLQENLATLSEDYKTRSRRWTASLKACAVKTKLKFDAYIQHKGSSGTIIFDHHEKTLLLTVQIDNLDASTKSSDVKNLSGGERSFVTFSLLLALGHVIECPFRLMDEYDVFLDEMARKMTLDVLQTYAFLPQQRNRQFIIISPHKLNDVKTNSKVKIIRMADPKRRAAHGLQQQTIDF